MFQCNENNFDLILFDTIDTLVDFPSNAKKR